MWICISTVNLILNLLIVNNRKETSNATKVFLNLWTVLLPGSLLTLTCRKQKMWLVASHKGILLSIFIQTGASQMCPHVIIVMQIGINLIQGANTSNVCTTNKHLVSKLAEASWKTSPFDYLSFSPKSLANFGSLPSEKTQLSQQLLQAECVCTY